jgi:hypothetical protein
MILMLLLQEKGPPCLLHRKQHGRQKIPESDDNENTLLLPVIELQSSGLWSVPAMTKLNLLHAHIFHWKSTSQLPSVYQTTLSFDPVVLFERWCVREVKTRTVEETKTLAQQMNRVPEHYRSSGSVTDNYQKIYLCGITRNFRCYTRLNTAFLLWLCTNLLCTSKYKKHVTTRVLCWFSY